MSSSNSVPASHALLNAEAQFLVGKFSVQLSQIKAHPNQRQLSEPWVDSLHQRFQEVGIERVAFPIKVILEKAADLDALLEKTDVAPTTDIPKLPANVNTLVYHGQHRVAACGRMTEEDEHWWFAEVYKPALESSHPAEFLTLMHMSNEDEHRLSTSDSDRCLVMHRLYCMHREHIITTDVFEANRSRLARAVVKDATRQGLGNLLVSQDLAESVARALQYPCLRASFNAGNWGKKLVKGRFFKLAACLVDEMVEQCRLLIDTHTNVSNKPFALLSQSCTWGQLEVGIKKKDHPWKELQGGAAAALARVQTRNPDFTSFLNPLGSDGWTLPRTVLLPSVLTSDSVFNTFKEMYHLAQHLIHMTAGPAHLAKYMHNSPHSQQDDHPVGIISWVLKDKFAGKPSNFPHKIVLVLWQRLQELTADLSKAKILVASETSKSDYKALINNSKPWWELLRMFKMSKLPGMDLIIPKVFAEDLPPPNGQLLQAIRNKHQITNGSQNQPSSTNGLGVEHSNATGSRAHSSSLTVEQPQPSTTQLKDPSAEASSAAASGNQSRVPHVAKRKQADSSEEEEELRPPKGSRTLKDNDTTAMTETESPTVSTILDSVGQRQIQKAMQQQLKQLSNIVSDLDAGDAKAMHQLLSNLLEMRGASYLGRVVGALSEKTPMLVERAKKAEKSSQEAEMDWELSETLEQVDAQL